MPSPNKDWGYDVADYCAVDPDLGTLEDLDALIEEAGRRGIRVLLDLVPNHTSDEHGWFQDALSGRDARHRDFYVWADPKPDGSPPNNWLSNFGGPAWTLHEPTGQYFLHNFLAEQPDLNWFNEEVRAAFDEILRFWYERGIAGFRIDVCHAIVNDAELRDDPPPGPDDHPEIRRRELKQVYSMNRPELHDVLRRWRAVSDEEDPPRMLVGETYVLDLESLIPFYGRGDELNLAFNFLFVHADLDAAQLRAIVEGVEAMLPEGSWPVYTGSNHDAGRLDDALGAGRPAPRPRRAAAPAHAARHAVPLLRRRARAARRPARPRDRARSAWRAARRPRGQPRRAAARRCPGATSGRRVHGRRRRRRGCRSATWPPTTSPTSARTRTRRCG